MIHISKGFVSAEDVITVNEYIKTLRFNTKDDHVPLHDDLFSNPTTMFDIHTRGEMPDHILEIFSKYSKGFYELVSAIEDEAYHPPMFSKHYICRYPTGSHSAIHWDNSKPDRTYKSYIFWNSEYSGGELTFPNSSDSVDISPGDLVYFIENYDNSHGISVIESGELFLSEAWMGHVGQHFMPNKVAYEDVDWEDWEIRGF